MIVKICIWVLFVVSMASAQPAVSIYLSNPYDPTQMLQQQPKAIFGGNFTGDNFIVEVFDYAPYIYNDVYGFGATIYDSSVKLLNSLSRFQKKVVLDALYDNDKGIGLNFAKTIMGSSSYSYSPTDYSYDDLPLNQMDQNMTQFSIQPDKYYQIPFIKQLMQYNPNMLIYALPDSPPGWMKATQNMQGGTLQVTNFDAMARYFVKYIQAYQQNGIKIYAIAAQNNPNVTSNYYPSNYMIPGDMSRFIANSLGPILQQNNIQINIFSEGNTWDNSLGSFYGNYTLNDTQFQSSQYISGAAYQCDPKNLNQDPTQQRVIGDQFQLKHVYFTQCIYPKTTNFLSGFQSQMLYHIIGSLRNQAAVINLGPIALDTNSGPILNLAPACSNCRGLITIHDGSTQRRLKGNKKLTTGDPQIFTKNSEYYALGHVSKFVNKGAKRIESNDPYTLESQGFKNVAFQNPDNSIVLIVLNTGQATEFTIRYRLSVALNTTLLPGQAATYIWKPS